MSFSQATSETVPPTLTHLRGTCNREDDEGDSGARRDRRGGSRVEKTESDPTGDKL